MSRITALINELKTDANGAKILSEWLGAGGQPVSQELAEARANTCKYGNNGSRCPKNIEPGWWDRVKHAVADAIRANIEVQNKIGLRVSNESELHMCKSCGCCLQLKVWVPIEHIAAHTTTEQYKDFPAWCWQRREILNEL